MSSFKYIVVNVWLSFNPATYNGKDIIISLITKEQFLFDLY